MWNSIELSTFCRNFYFCLFSPWQRSARQNLEDQKYFSTYILKILLQSIRNRCYDHNFLRLLTIFGEKIGVFLKNKCYDQIFSKFSFILSKKRQLFRRNFRRKYFKNHNIGPWSQTYDFWIYNYIQRQCCSRRERFSCMYVKIFLLSKSTI
jgi:hypothetical protein